MPRLGWAVLASLLAHSLFIAWLRPQGGRLVDEAPPLAATLRVPLPSPREAADPLADRSNALPRSRPLAVPGARSQAVVPPVEERPVSIDLEQARQIARATSRSTAPQHPQPLAVEPETPLARAIARSASEDCRTAYAGTGLFALPLLLRDAVTAKGCIW